jgi:hypothetical protein
VLSGKRGEMHFSGSYALHGRRLTSGTLKGNLGLGVTGGPAFGVPLPGPDGFRQYAGCDGGEPAAMAGEPPDASHGPHATPCLSAS